MRNLITQKRIALSKKSAKEKHSKVDVPKTCFPNKGKKKRKNPK